MTCPECEARPVAAKGLCNPCYKRLVWRPTGGSAVEHDRANSHRWKAENSRFCVDCGTPIQYDSTRCNPCSAPFNGEGMRRKVQARRERIAAMYLAGASYKTIAAELGWQNVGGELTRMRKAGWDLLYRRKAYERKAAA